MIDARPSGGAAARMPENAPTAPPGDDDVLAAEDKLAAAATVLMRVAVGVDGRPRAHRRNIGVVFRQVNHCTRYG
jgi:hypothetical protein